MARINILKAYTIILIVFLYIPIFITFIYSFNNSRFVGTWHGFTLKWYKLLLHDSEAWSSFKNSMIVAISSAVISISLALPVGISLNKRDRDLANLLSYPPIIIPEITEAVALMIVFIKLGVPLGPITVVIGHTAFNVAYAYIALSPTGSRGARLAMAARSLGASKLTAYTRVVIPLAMPGIIAALGLTFLMSFTDFIKTLFTTGPGFETLPLLIWNRARRPGLTQYTAQPALAALGSVLIGLSIAIALAYTLYEFRRSESA